MNNPSYAVDESFSAPSGSDAGREISCIGSYPGEKYDVPELLELVLDAHGGLERWKQFDKVSASVVTGGFLWRMKGIPIDESLRRMTSGFRRQWSRTQPFGDPQWHMTYTPDRVAIETQSGEIENSRTMGE